MFKSQITNYNICGFQHTCFFIQPRVLNNSLINKLKVKANNTDGALLHDCHVHLFLENNRIQSILKWLWECCTLAFPGVSSSIHAVPFCFWNEPSHNYSGQGVKGILIGLCFWNYLEAGRPGRRVIVWIRRSYSGFCWNHSAISFFFRMISETGGWKVHGISHMSMKHHAREIKLGSCITSLFSLEIWIKM